jgi:protein-disulfide isomerase
MRRRNLKKHVMKRMGSVAAVMVLSVGLTAVAQAPTAATPTAPAPQSGAQVSFPKVELKNFTATSPTVDEVNSFLKAMWGYDDNRVWEVAAIMKTQAPGVARVVAFVAEKSQPDKGTSTVFFTTPDGKHAIAGKVMDFGAKPFADDRALLQARADGPSRGAKGNDLMLVEFADLQCPHCKDAQATMDNLATDFPEAKIVFENFPLADLHPAATAAAAAGLCVRKLKGDAAFFTYAQNVFNKQAGLTDSAAATLSAAETAAGADPKAVEACAVTQAAKDELAAEVKLGTELGVDQTPTLVVNGYALSMDSLPYSVLRRIIAYRANQDGIPVHLQPQLSTLK